MSVPSLFLYVYKSISSVFQFGITINVQMVAVEMEVEELYFFGDMGGTGSYININLPMLTLCRYFKMDWHDVIYSGSVETNK